MAWEQIYDVFGHSTEEEKPPQLEVKAGRLVRVEEVFASIAQRLRGFTAQNFHVDYFAHPATGGSGASRPGSGIITLPQQTLRADPVDIITTMIHEAAHEVDPRIVDIAYRTEPIFRGMQAGQKLANADHYAEVADQLLRNVRRRLVPKATGPASGGEKSDRLDHLINQAQSGIRELWDMSLNMYDNILPKLAPGINFDTGLPLGDAPDSHATMKELITKLAIRAHDLPPSDQIGSPAHYALIGTTTVILSRAMHLAAAAITAEANKLDRGKRIEEIDSAAFRLAWSLIFNAGGLYSDRKWNAELHRRLLEMYTITHNKSLYV